jgi:hypothetical protein
LGEIILQVAAHGIKDLTTQLLGYIVSAVSRRKQAMSTDDELDPLMVSLASLFRTIIWHAHNARESLAASVSLFLDDQALVFIEDKVVFAAKVTGSYRL